MAMIDGTGAAGVKIPAPQAPTGIGAGIFPEDTPAAPRQWRCQHCGALIIGKVLASFNGAPLCLGTRDRDDEYHPNCYRLVSQFQHQMPCLGDPCPGEVVMEHDHGEEEDHGVR